MVPEERSTPPPIRRPTTRLATPLVKARNTTIGSQGSSSARVSALAAPRLEYPYEARRQRITGSGIAVLTVDPVSGSVTSVMMEASTGSPVLDNAAVTGFRRWRFKPGTVSNVRLPITYTLTGAQY
jgi:TonB family protein